MNITARHALAGLALALASQACTTEDVSNVSSELGLPPGGGNGNNFYWAAYAKAPYIYKGCPDPGPEPWAERATLLARRGTGVLELELGTAVALDVRALSLPRGVRLVPNTRGATITVDDPSVGEPLALSIGVASGRCAYDLEAEIAYQ
jgi:hypothetical protein